MVGLKMIRKFEFINKSDLVDEHGYHHFFDVVQQEYIDSLKAENERLKAENERLDDLRCNFYEWRENRIEDMKEAVNEIRTLRKENAKLRCLALHAMAEWLSALLWLAGTDLGKCLVPHIDVNLCVALRIKYNEAYRKAKQELMEGK